MIGDEFMPNYMRQRAIEGSKVSDSFKYSRTFTQEEAEHFGDIARDYNPVHHISSSQLTNLSHLVLMTLDSHTDPPNY